MRSTLAALLASAPSILAQSPTLLELLRSQPDLTSLTDALTAVPDFAAIAETLTDVTILAPVDAAFQQLLAGGVNAESQAIEMRMPDGILTLLAYHVLNGTYNSSSFTQTPTFVNTIFNQSYSIFDTIRTNVTEGQNVGLVLNGETAAILSGELQVSNVIEADITAIPGVTIHKIDRILTIPLNLTDTLTRLSTVGASAAFGALETANLTLRTEVDGETAIETLDTVEDLTIFLPNNDAFAAAASALQGADLSTLEEVLQYHTITGSVVFANEITNTTIESVSSGQLTLGVIDGSIFVNQARVILPNILLSNGVMHIIDTVLNPATSNFDRDTIDPNAPPAPAFEDASAIGDQVPFTSAALPPSTTISIPALATTAEVVSPTAGSDASPTSAQVSTFTGAAESLAGHVPAAVVGVVAALLM